MTFQDQYKRPEWQKKRLEKLESTGFECESCGEKTKQLHVHHHIYRKGKKIWEYDLEELETLCLDCHKTRHDIKDDLKELLAEATISGLAADEMSFGVITSVCGPSFFHRSTNNAEIMGKILGRLLDLESMDNIFHIVKSEIENNKLDALGDSDQLKFILNKTDVFLKKLLLKKTKRDD